MIQDYVKTGKPLLGICLGMQLLFEESEEEWSLKGLDCYQVVLRFPGTSELGETYKVPHMGWNKLKWVNPSPITKDLEEDYVYFVHSYYVGNRYPE